MAAGAADGSAVAAYLASLPQPTRDVVELVRGRAQAVVPGTTEKLSYGIVAFCLEGHPYAYCGGFAKHVSLYPLPDADAAPALAARLAPYVAGPGTAKFLLRDPMPWDLVDELLATLGEQQRVPRPRR